MIEKVKNAYEKIMNSAMGYINLKKEEKEKEDISGEILSLISEAKENLNVARNNFNYACDDSLLEYRIYELKAAESRLGYFLKMAKEKNISNEAFKVFSCEEGSACL